MSILYVLHNSSFMAAILVLLALLLASFETTKIGAQNIGVCFGGNADNLPSKEETVELYKSNNIGRMRIYDPDPTSTLQALRGSNIELLIDVRNEDLQAFAINNATANEWVQRNIVNYISNVNFKYIAVGNEVQPSDPRVQFVLPAIQNIYSSILSNGLQDRIKVSTAIDLRYLGINDPPSNGIFSDDAKSYVEPVIHFLLSINSPILANVYPYFSYVFNTHRFNLSYALLTEQRVVEQDGQFGYKNLFEALVDALYSAIEKVGGEGLVVVVSESGWPSDGRSAATSENAGTYYRNLIDHVKEGTPKRPGKAIETYLFSMFDENLKGPDEIEKHFGLFFPNKQPKYQIRFG